MPLQDARDIAANRNNSQVLPPRDIEAEKHDSLGEAMSSKLRRHLRMGKHHSVAVPAIFGDRKLPSRLPFRSGFSICCELPERSGFLATLGT